MDTKSVFFYVGLCISNFEEWHPVESITSTLCVFHSHIGEILYEGKDSTSLREEGYGFIKMITLFQGVKGWDKLKNPSYPYFMKLAYHILIQH